MLGGEKTNKQKHISIFLTTLAGQSSPVPGTNGTKWRFHCGIKQKTAGLSQGRVPIRGGVPFVPGIVPVCPGHRPAQNVCVYRVWIFTRVLGTDSCTDLLDKFSVPLPTIQPETWLVHAEVREPHLNPLVV